MAKKAYASTVKKLKPKQPASPQEVAPQGDIAPQEATPPPMEFQPEQGSQDTSGDSWLAKVWESAKTRPEPNKFSPIENIAVGATPLLVGMLMGDTGTGADVAAKGLAEQQKQEYDIAMTARKQRAKLASSSNKPIYQKVENPNGVIDLYRHNYETGKLEDTGKIAGYAPGYIKDSEGIYNRVNKASGKITKPADLGLQRLAGYDYTPEQKSELLSLAQHTASSKRYMHLADSLDASDSALGLLQSNTKITDSALNTVIPRMLGNVGNLTDREQALYTISPDIVNLARTLRNKWFNSRETMTAKDRNSLIMLSQVFKQINRAKIKNYLEGVAKLQGSFSGLESNKIFSGLSTLMPKGVNIDDAIKKAKKHAETSVGYTRTLHLPHGEVQNFKKNREDGLWYPVE